MAAQQLRLLLWKDYLIRKRKAITLAGIIWATAVMVSLYIVRVNVDNSDYPTCQFPARALPSAGMLVFLQSFICSVNNECSPMDQFDEIPTYENSKLTQLQRQFAPLLYNETVIDIAGSVPDALRLLSKLADIVDEPTFVDITKNGLKVNDLFNNPTRVKRYLSNSLRINDDVANNVMTSDLSFQGIFKGTVDRCSAESISGVILMKNSEALDILVVKLCNLSDKDVQKILMDLMIEVNFDKFIRMIGNMYKKLSGDDRLTKLGATVTAVMRMSRLQSFLPAELVAMLPGDNQFSYIDLTLIPKTMDLFKPTFGDTESYKSIRDFADTAVLGATYLSRFIVKQTNSTEIQDVNKEIADVNKVFNNAVKVVEEATAGDEPIDVFNVLTQITKLIYKWLPDNLKHDVLFYSTLLAKLIDGAEKVININMHIEEKAYEVSLRHPKGVEILVGLSGAIIGKGFEALTNAERTQIMTAKIDNPGQMFCDLNRLQGFFQISKEEATSLRSQLCTNEWKNYVADLIKTFGIYEVKDNINTMASLVIQETLGKDTSNQLYTIEYDFQVLKNFTQSLKSINEKVPSKDWKKLFNVTDDSEFMKTVRDKGRLGKQMLVVIHGALAKMVVNQNAILSFKISPAFIDTTTLVTAINKQIGATDKALVDRVKRMYPAILLTVLETALDEKKSYKALSTHSTDIMCNGVDNALSYLVMPDSADKEELVATLCDISTAIEKGLAKDSEFGKAIENIRNPKRGPFDEVKWTELITGLKDLYLKLDTDYPYLLEYSSYNMDEDRRSLVNGKFEEAKAMWFSSKSFGRSLHLSVKLLFRLLDLMDRDIFGISDEFWLRMKHGINTVTGPAVVLDDFVKLVTAISKNESYTSDFPTITASALRVIIPNAPKLIIDTADNIVKDNTELEPIIALLNTDPPWPCSESLTTVVELPPESSTAVQALETIGCARGLREEWRKHLEAKNITVFNPRHWNTTVYSPHLFLKFSSVFDSMLEDGQLLKDAVEQLSREDSERVTWNDAWRHIEELWERDDRDDVMRSFLRKLDLVLGSINTTSTPGSLHALWSAYLQCAGEECNDIGRTTLKYTLEFFSVMFQNIAEDLEIYFREIHEPNSSVLSLLGFTRGTALYDMYDRLPDLMGVLLNSYFDYGFMSQIRRASNSQFWDCEALVRSLSPPPGSRIAVSDIKRMQPFICPSFLYWLSLPRGDNTLLDVVAKPQYYFYTVEAQNLTSNYSEAFEKVTKLVNLFTDIINKNNTQMDEKDIKLNTIQEKLDNLVGTVINYEINKTDEDYLHFYDINKKQIATTVYLTRIIAIINKIAINVENLKIYDIKTDEETTTKIETELISIQKIFKRRPSDIAAVHFDILTDLVWNDNEKYTIVNAFEAACNSLKNNDTSKDLVVENMRVKNQICSKNYKVIYEAVDTEFNDERSKARNSLLNLIKVLQNDNNDNVTDVFEFLNQRQQLTNSLKTTIKYAYDLSIPIYLKYLQSNLQHYGVIISFLNGGDWWSNLRELYRGEYATNFFDSLEKSFEITENVLSRLDEIHVVRLLRDINVNSSDAFCSPTITLSDYLPDATASLSMLHRQLCDANRSQLFAELPQLVFASQGYDSNLKLSKDVNYTNLYSDVSKVETQLDEINEPETPRRPQWVTAEKLAKLRVVAGGLLSKDSLTRISFGILSNVVDAGTLFLNNSECTLCSQLTSWFKQLNLQVFKKQEYENLLCHMHEMTLEDVHYTLKYNFHWDMAITELISTRNYTKYELNKSINEFLEVVKLHLLEDIQGPNTKLAECLARNVSRNGFGNVTLFVSILSHTARLLRAEAPHLAEIEGVATLPYLQQLAGDVAHNLHVSVPLNEYLNEETEIGVVKGGELNLKSARNLQLSDIKLKDRNWYDICNEHNCSVILEDVNKSLNWALIDRDLPILQNKQFWRFTFMSHILEHTEQLLAHVGRLLGVASRVDLQGVGDGRLEALIDFLMQVLMEDSLNGIVYSVQGIVEELHPLLKGTSLEHDLEAVSTGLIILQQFKNYVLETEDLNVEVGRYFSAAHVEAGLGALGINNTNFWSLAAPRLHAGHLQLKPLFAKQDEYHISSFVCQMEPMSRVIIPADLDVVTAEDVHAAIIEQFCGLSDERAKEIVPVLIENMNFTAVMDRVKTTLLSKLYAASNLTEEEGATVLEMYPQMTALLPVIQDSVGDLSDTIANEPLIQSLRSADSVGGLLGSAEFLSSAGQMLCGKPFQTDQNRFYAAIAKSTDFSNEVDQAQLDVLPTDFCRSLYTDIVNMDGGKIVWSFVKPLIMGKILYTPVNPAVQTIIEQANSTFSHMIKLTSLIHSFSSSFSTIHLLSEHREGINALRSIMSAPAFSDLRDSLVGGDVGQIDVDGLFDGFGDLEGIGSLLKKASDLLHCINMNRFQPVTDEYQLTHEAVKLSRVNEFSAGIVFLKTGERAGEPTNVEYKIRMDIENVPTTSRKKNYLWIPGPESSFIEHMRYFRGFVQIQDIIDRAVIELSRSSARQKRETSIDEWSVYTQQEPYPCYRKDFFQTSLYESQALIVAFFFSLLFTVSSAVRFIVADKESGNTMLMSVMGVNLRNHTLSWFIASTAEMLITCCCIAAVLNLGGILPNTDVTLLLFLLFVFGISVLAFCYMMSKLFSSASYAAVCTGIAYLCSFMPFIIILSLEAVMTSTLKLFVCLSMSSAICYSFLFVTRLEARGAGAGWGDVWRTDSDADGTDMSIGAGAAMALLDAALYLLVGYLLDRYFGLKTQQTSITNCTTSNEKAGVSIVNITKVYGEGTKRSKVALDNVSIELHKGQITTLLGHNGAGKTTLTNILTGMLKPTKGHVIIRSDTAQTRTGVCPQRDVLFPCLSAREHIALYAQIKSGKSYDDVREEVESMLQVLSLGEVSSRAVCKLSGGTRRRLCVALAFVATPALVSLDEPTAGVDPSARRDIWSMIEKLRADRTILLTTHHLDEAELLSDQIVIMHKGQIHTVGSPIEIKRSLGCGYKLSVTFPCRPQEWSDEDLEEKTKQLLAVVREDVRNASLVDVTGAEVEITLPFFDANGLNTNYLQLCKQLEGRQHQLGFKSYSMDCCSLEQVFFNICQQADGLHGIELDPDAPSHSASTSSIKNDKVPLVPTEGPLKGEPCQQLLALLHARYLHYIRNRGLLFLLVLLPMIFVTTAMGFSLIRPPADNEVTLRLYPDLYEDSTQYLVSRPSIYSEGVDSAFAERVMSSLSYGYDARNWTSEDTPSCKCTESRQVCEAVENGKHSRVLLFPDVDRLNDWIVSTQHAYMETRYGGYSSTLKRNMTQFIAWYNNKGHHAMPAYLNALNNALLRTVSGERAANITVYSHPLKISKEQISKDTVYQHIADAGISSLVLIAYSLVSAGAAIYLVSARRSQEKRLQLLCGVSPVMYWAAAMTADMAIIVINMVITAIVFEAFGFPVFVARSNLPAICLLILLYGYACGSFVHVCSRLFSEASLANMLLFCGNAFLGLVGITLLLILDIISDSDETDHARWVLHKVFMLSPQFVLGDGLLEIAKNTIQAQVLHRFGMDTYKDPLSSDLIVYHYVSLVLVGTVLTATNLAIEYGCFEGLVDRFQSEPKERRGGEMEDMEVTAERQRVQAAIARAAEGPLRLKTIGNINAGFVETEPVKGTLRPGAAGGDVAACLLLHKSYSRVARPAVDGLSLGIPAGQCIALLGQNGAGKSTTFSMLTGEVRPSSGKIYLNDTPVDSRQLCQGLISYCPQSDAVDPLMTVRETLAFFCQLRGITEQGEVIKRTLEMFELCKYSEVRNGTLSGGNKRKLCAAIAFMGRTPLVLLDEPTSGMDPVSRACVSRGAAASLQTARGVLLSTHALQDARRLAARVAMLRAGRLAALAHIDDCLRRFGGGYVVSCRCRGSPRDVWRRLRATAPGATLTALHHHTLHCLLPASATVDKKEITTSLSDVFRLMAELTSTCDIEDFTVNQSSLDQMFLSFTERSTAVDAVELDPLPTPLGDDELDSITSL